MNINLIGVDEFEKIENQFLNLQNQGKYKEAADFVNETVKKFEAQDFRRENELEWLFNLINQETMSYLLDIQI